MQFQELCPKMGFSFLIHKGRTTKIWPRFNAQVKCSLVPRMLRRIWPHIVNCTPTLYPLNPRGNDFLKIKNFRKKVYTYPSSSTKANIYKSDHHYYWPFAKSAGAWNYCLLSPYHHTVNFTAYQHNSILILWESKPTCILDMGFMQN